MKLHISFSYTFIDFQLPNIKSKRFISNPYKNQHPKKHIWPHCSRLLIMNYDSSTRNTSQPILDPYWSLRHEYIRTYTRIYTRVYISRPRVIIIHNPFITRVKWVHLFSTLVQKHMWERERCETRTRKYRATVLWVAINNRIHFLWWTDEWRDAEFIFGRGKCVSGNVFFAIFDREMYEFIIIFFVWGYFWIERCQEIHMNEPCDWNNMKSYEA